MDKIINIMSEIHVSLACSIRKIRINHSTFGIVLYIYNLLPVDFTKKVKITLRSIFREMITTTLRNMVNIHKRVVQ